MANLKKMNTGISLTPSDFELYQTLSQSLFYNMNDILFGTIIEQEIMNIKISMQSLLTFGHIASRHILFGKNKIK